jgi:hypothetical protein
MSRRQLDVGAWRPRGHTSLALAVPFPRLHGAPGARATRVEPGQQAVALDVSFRSGVSDLGIGPSIVHRALRIRPRVSSRPTPK